MDLRNADVWLVGVLLLAGCALAGYALGQAIADHEQARAPADGSGGADGSAPDARASTGAHGPGAFRWLPLVGGMLAPPAEGASGHERTG